MSKYNVNKFKQITVALNTPFDQKGNVDLEAARKVVDYFCNKGIKQMYVCGSTGEGFLLDTEERMAVTEAVVSQAAGRMNIIVHVGCPDTRHSALLTEHACKTGADAISAVPCVYYRMGEESVYARLQLPKPPICRFLSIIFLSSQDFSFPWGCLTECLKTNGWLA